FDDLLRVGDRLEEIDAPFDEVGLLAGDLLAFLQQARRPSRHQRRAHGRERQSLAARGDRQALHHATNCAKRARSTLPPEMITPTRLPAISTPPCSAPAKPRQPVGSTTIFIRSAKKRMPCTSWSSLAVRTSATSRRMMPNVIS